MGAAVGNTVSQIATGLTGLTDRPFNGEDVGKAFALGALTGGTQAAFGQVALGAANATSGNAIQTVQSGDKKKVVTARTTAFQAAGNSGSAPIEAVAAPGAGALRIGPAAPDGG